jgi:anti-anti-sigma factor
VLNQFRVDVHSEHEATVLAVTGELDLASSPALDSELARASEAGAKLIIVDLRELEFMDSTGLSVLVKADQRAKEAGTRFGLAGGPPQVRRLLSMTGVGERMTVVEQPEELLRHG